jgi:hypothetical protein
MCGNGSSKNTQFAFYATCFYNIKQHGGRAKFSLSFTLTAVTNERLELGIQQIMFQILFVIQQLQTWLLLRLYRTYLKRTSVGFIN